MPNRVICFLWRYWRQVGYSVIKTGCNDSIKTLVDPRLGLPAEDENCGTCGGTNYEENAGETDRLDITSFKTISVICSVSCPLLAW